jgi:hypothetical protein
MAKLFRLVTVLLIMCFAWAAQAQSVRFTDYSVFVEDNFEQIEQSVNHIPSAGSIGSIQTRTTQIGEATHTCRSTGASVGSHSVWFAVNFAGGTLNIDTEGSNYNTVMSVYRRAGQFASLTSVACNDDHVPAVDTRANISVVLPADVYYIQISRFETAPTGAALTLQLSLAAIYSGLAPDNDNFSSAKSIKFNKAVTVNNIQYATEEASEPNRACGGSPPSASVWFKLTVPENLLLAAFNVTTEGSFFNNGLSGSVDSVVEVFSGATLGTLASIACSDDAFANYGALTNVAIPPGETTVYFRVTSFSTANMVGASRVKLKVTLAAYIALSRDYSFEEVPTTQWITSNLSGDGQVCGVTPNPNDDCVFRFAGGPDEAATLKQKFSIPPVIVMRKDHQLLFVFTLTASDPGTNVLLKVTIPYTDGTPPTVLKRKLQGSISPTAFNVIMVTNPASKNIGQITMLVKNRGTSGTWDLNQAAGIIFGTAARDTRTAPDGLLPLPAAADLQ